MRAPPLARIAIKIPFILLKFLVMPRHRRTYACEKCGFFTHVSTSFKRHMARKTSCTPSVLEGKSFENEDINVVKKDINVVKKDINVVKKDINVVKKDINVVKKDINVVKKDINVVNELQCEECEKIFSNKKTLRTHQQRGLCKGIAVLQCKDCDQRFDNRHAKYNHMRRGKCAALCQSVTNNNNIDNSVTNNNIDNSKNSHNTVNNTNNNTTNNNVYVSFGSEDFTPITSEKFINFLMHFNGPDKLIPTAKALYFHPEYPENHGTLKPKSTKNKTVSVRKKDGSYYTGYLDIVFGRFVKNVLPIVIRDPNTRFLIETEMSTNKTIKMDLSKQLLNLINENPVISKEEVERDFHTRVCDEPKEAFRWPSDIFWDRVMEGNFYPNRHVVYMEEPLQPEEMYGVGALYRELVGEKGIPPGCMVEVRDNGLDDKWTVARVWEGWTQLRRKKDVVFTNDIGYFFACMAVDLCEAMCRYAAKDPAVQRNFPEKIDAARKLAEDLTAGRLHPQAVRSLYYGI